MKKFSLFLLTIVAATALVGCAKTAPVTTTGTGNLDSFAQCLSGAGVKMYGTATCSHCIKQKELFGASFKYINYVDCIVAPTMCSSIAGTPTRRFADGSTLLGEQTLQTLAAKTNCVLNR